MFVGVRVTVLVAVNVRVIVIDAVTVWVKVGVSVAVGLGVIVEVGVSVAVSRKIRDRTPPLTALIRVLSNRYTPYKIPISMIIANPMKIYRR